VLHAQRIPSRDFLPWRLSDDGPSASRTVTMGRHPKPFTIAEVELACKQIVSTVA